MGSCSALHSKLTQFRSTEKYCDVTILVQDKSFPCHRVLLASASEYFDVLFGGSFMEKDARETVLHDIDVETFEEILRCVYTEETCKITAGNVLNLLSASLFLKINLLEKACTEYVLKNVSSIQDHIRIFALARSLNLTALMNVVTGYVIQNFKSFYNDETLLELMFDDLSFILDRWSKNRMPFKYDDILLHFLIRWVHQAFEERREYFLKLIAAVDFERISPHYVRLMIQYFKDIDQPDLEGMPPLNLPPVMEKSESTLDSPVENYNTENSEERLCFKRKLFEHFSRKRKSSVNCGEEIPASFYEPTFYNNVLGVHLYVEFITLDCQKNDKYGMPVRRSEGVKVLSSNRYYTDWFVSCETNAWRNCMERRTIVHESTNRLYCMEIFEDDHNISADIRQSFCTYSSVDLKLASSVLTSPPVPLRKNHFEMCATFWNDIYLLNFGMDEHENYYEPFFYQYNCEVDKWFPVPRMKFPHLNYPSICADHNLIYVIDEHKGYHHKFQAFDHRSGKWMKLPTCSANSHFCDKISSCVLQGKVFVSCSPANTDCYDVVAGKWESIHQPKEREYISNNGLRMLSYDKKLWLLYANPTSYPHLYSLATFSPDIQKWYHYDDFKDAVHRAKRRRTDGIFLYQWHVNDMITFKTCS